MIDEKVQPDFRRIKGFSEVTRIPRLGKIRLGIKMETKNGGIGYPKETDYFVCPVEVQRVYGVQPKELDIMFPIDDERDVFPQAYKWYAGKTLKCKGNGEYASRRVQDLTETQKKERADDLPDDPYAWVDDFPCPCPLLDPDENGKSKCNKVASLSFMLPNVSLAGVYQIDTRSAYSIININSALQLARSMVGRIAMIPFKLRRIAQSIEYEGKMQTHYILSLGHELSIGQVQKMRGEPLMLPGRVSVKSRENPGAMRTDFSETPGSTGIMEDVTPGESRPQEMDVDLLSVVKQPGKNDRYWWEIKAQENRMENTPLLEFLTLDDSLAAVAGALHKDGLRAAVTYEVTAKGKFKLLGIDKEIPF